MLQLRLLAGGCALLTIAAAVAAAPAFDLNGEIARLHSFFADKQAEIGDGYRNARLFEPARAHYQYAVELEPDHAKARKGLGQKKKGDQWVEHEPLPEKSPLPEDKQEAAREKPDAAREKAYEKCADRARKAVQAAKAAKDDRAARVLAAYVLRYAPHDQDARALRGHAKSGEEWMPAFAADWREQGRKCVDQAGFGEEQPGEDEQAKTIGAQFARRKSEHLMIRTTGGTGRAGIMHRNAHAHMQHAMDLLGVESSPFGEHTFTLTQLKTDDEYFAMLEKVLKLSGDELEFGKQLSGYSQRNPWGYITKNDEDGPADDMLGNVVAVRVLQQFRANHTGSRPWQTTGFSYLVTSNVLGTCITAVFAMKELGRTGTKTGVLPDLNKRVGDPALMRDAILAEVKLKRDVPIERLVNVEINDMRFEYAAKAFSLMEFFFSRHADAARKWLAEAEAPADKRLEAIARHFGKSAVELENEWREWVLLSY